MTKEEEVRDLTRRGVEDLKKRYPPEVMGTFNRLIIPLFVRSIRKLYERTAKEK